MTDLFSPQAPGGATFSPCARYRYRLWRDWDATKPALTFVMLNPSTADEVTNDATIERCQRRAIEGGFGRLNVVNIFAYRSTDPDVLYSLRNTFSNGAIKCLPG
jgi:hypothetical protein